MAATTAVAAADSSYKPSTIIPPRYFARVACSSCTGMPLLFISANAWHRWASSTATFQAPTSMQTSAVTSQRLPSTHPSKKSCVSEACCDSTLMSLDPVQHAIPYVSWCEPSRVHSHIPFYPSIAGRFLRGDLSLIQLYTYAGWTRERVGTCMFVGMR